MHKTVHIVYFLFFCKVVTAQDVQPRLAIQGVHPDFYVFTTSNTYNGVTYPSNGMYVVSDNGILMIDMPWDSTQYQPLLDSIWHKHHQRVKAIIGTHYHADRTGGFNFYKARGIPTYTSLQTDSFCLLRNEKRAQFHFQQDTVFRFGKYRAEVIYPGAGHTEDNLVVWFPDVEILYGGCLVKSTEATDLGNVADAHVLAWPITLQRLMTRIPQPVLVVPGHGSWERPGAISHTLDLLKR